MSLNESFNTPNWKNHPIKTALDRNEEEGKSSDYMINATHLPKWFTKRKGHLKKEFLMKERLKVKTREDLNTND